jgi:hypothetical protein
MISSLFSSGLPELNKGRISEKEWKSPTCSSAWLVRMRVDARVDELV